ncbi:YchJ family metal-binding protein [Spirillospora sp. NPDC029432]|uniref:YchJ family protein n=1 Tax=Spirillospora sp. NPDC029432 TaxID=3154599 RepID=UPI0034568A37
MPKRPATCPCGSSAPYRDCCGRLHRGQAQARTAEELMRSRFSAFAVRDAAYLLKSWHPGTRPRTIDLPAGLRWERLEILNTAEGSPFHTKGTVEFRAYHSQGELHEVSRFVRHEGAWVYLDGDTA